MVDTVSVKRCPEGSSRMAALQAKKQALEEKLAARNEELRKLCIQEAELTGKLPPEIPLEPGESPPQFRRVVGTGYSYPKNLINKLKTNEVESIAALELDKQVQVNISEAALSLAAASKAASRSSHKHRLVYQQSQKRLTELDERLSYLITKNTPSSGNNSNEHKNIQQFSPQNQSHSPQLLHQSQHGLPHFSPQFSHQQQFLSHTLQHSPQSHSHSQYSLQNQPTKYKKKPRPATIDVDKEHRVHLPFDDMHSAHCSTHSGSSDHMTTMRPIIHERIERTTSAIHQRQQIQLAPHQQYEAGLGGYWMCLDNGETVWCSLEPNYWQRETRFGSLDRSKARPLQHKWSAPVTVEADDIHRHIIHSSTGHIKTMPDLNKYHRLQSHQDMYNTVESANIITDNWHILQAHSLGNVASQSTVDSVGIAPYRERTGSRKYKQKKWYETTLDAPQRDNTVSGVSATNSHRTGSLENMLPPHSPYHHSPLLQTPTKSPQQQTNSSPQINVSCPSPHPPTPTPTPPNRVVPFDLTCESIFPNNNSNTVPVQSPKNCTVIQPGQWKPYREVTKPFEMSDFYKYSTKFRNRNTNNNDNTVTNEERSDEKSINITATATVQTLSDNIENGVDVTDNASLVYQKGVYQPLHPMKCQPYLNSNSLNGTAESLVDNSSSVDTSKKKLCSVSPLVPVEQTSQSQNTSYGILASHHVYPNTTTTNLKNNCMHTSTLV